MGVNRRPAAVPSTVEQSHERSCELHAVIHTYHVGTRNTMQTVICVSEYNITHDDNFFFFDRTAAASGNITAADGQVALPRIVRKRDRGRTRRSV